MKKIPELFDAVVLSESEVAEILWKIGWKTLIEAIAESFREESEGNIICPSKIVLDVENYNNDFRVMPCYIKKYPDYCGLKVVCACPDNPVKYGLPTVLGHYILHDAKTQTPLMFASASALTAWRTAAATAVAVRALWKSQPNVTLGIIGAGLQAGYHIEALNALFYSEGTRLKEVLVADVDENKIKNLQEYFSLDDYPRIVKSEKKTIFTLCDVIVTLTPTTKPHIFKGDILNRHLVITAVGGDSSRKIELEPEILTIADCYCDSLSQVSHTGIMEAAKRRNISVKCTGIGDVLTGRCDIPSRPEVKLFLSTGTAFEDLITAQLIYENLSLIGT